MVLDAAVVAIAVRTTARISAVLLAANLLIVARRLAIPTNQSEPVGATSSGTSRTRDLATFGAFLVSHTVHFASVALLAQATGGENIRANGGWTAAIVVATLFYLGGWGVWRGKARFSSGWTSATQRRLEIGVLVVVWLIFVPAFAVRSGTLFFAGLTAGLAYSLIRFLIAAMRSASQSAPASV